MATTIDKPLDLSDYQSDEMIGISCSASPVPEDELRPSVQAGHAVDITGTVTYESGMTHARVMRVELEANTPNDYVDHGFKVFISDPTIGVDNREFMFTYDHGHKAIFEHNPLPFTWVTEQMIGAALYYFFIYCEQDASRPKYTPSIGRWNEIVQEQMSKLGVPAVPAVPTLEQWTKEWHEIIQKNVRAQMAQFNPVRG